MTPANRLDTVVRDALGALTTNDGPLDAVTLLDLADVLRRWARVVERWADEAVADAEVGR